MRSRIAAALGGVPRARALHQNLPHRERRDGEEVRAVLPVVRVLGDQPDVGFVDERRRLQRLPGLLAAEVRRGQPAQLVVDERHQLRDGLVVAGSGSREQFVSDWSRATPS